MTDADTVRASNERIAASILESEIVDLWRTGTDTCEIAGLFEPTSDNRLIKESRVYRILNDWLDRRYSNAPAYARPKRCAPFLRGGGMTDAPELDFCMTPEQRRKVFRSRAKPPGLHAAVPGSGPLGETCGTCRHLARKRMSKTYLKCELARAYWTGGAGSDVKSRDPSCSKWEAQ